MNGPRTVLCVPTVTELGGQCRLYTLRGHVSAPLAHYRRQPDSWAECGHVRGGIVRSFDGTAAELAELRACEPIAGGYAWQL